MKYKHLYSIKMRASQNGKHISGGERIVHKSKLKKIIPELVNKALNHSRGTPDNINIKIELIKEEPILTPLISIFEITDPQQVKPHKLIEKILMITRISAGISRNAYDLILKGASPDGDVMRGAMIIDIKTGKRLELDSYRGVRVSCMDITEEALEKFKSLVKSNYTENFKEAAVLSTKVMASGKILAELCISDDPDYTTGYVSLKDIGYIRIPGVKPAGLAKGGRAFFVDENNTDIEKLYDFLEKKPVIVTDISGYSTVSVEEIEALSASSVE